METWWSLLTGTGDKMVVPVAAMGTKWSSSDRAPTSLCFVFTPLSSTELLTDVVPGSDVGLGWCGNRVQMVQPDCLHAPVEYPRKGFGAMDAVPDDSVDVPCKLGYWVANFRNYRRWREILVSRAGHKGPGASPSGQENLMNRDLGDLDALKVRSADLQECFEHLPFSWQVFELWRDREFEAPSDLPDVSPVGWVVAAPDVRRKVPRKTFLPTSLLLPDDIIGCQ